MALGTAIVHIVFQEHRAAYPRESRAQAGWDPDENREDRIGRAEGRNQTPDGSEKNPAGPGVNRKQGHICKYVSNAPIMAIFVNSPKDI